MTARMSTKLTNVGVTISIASLVLVAAVTLRAQTSGDGPRYTNGTDLVFPDEYREWRFLSSGLSMTYEDEGDGSEAGLRLFQNVFVNPSSYRAFMETGTWPEGEWRWTPFLETTERSELLSWIACESVLVVIVILQPGLSGLGRRPVTALRRCALTKASSPHVAPRSGVAIGAHEPGGGRAHRHPARSG